MILHDFIISVNKPCNSILVKLFFVIRDVYIVSVLQFDRGERVILLYGIIPIIFSLEFIIDKSEPEITLDTRFELYCFKLLKGRSIQ